MKNEHKDMSLEEAQKSPKVRAEAIEFLLETTVIAAKRESMGLDPMTILEMGSAALKVLGVGDEELTTVTKNMVESRLAHILGGGNVN